MKLKQLTLAVCVLAPAMAFAQATPVGLWKTIDDGTKAEKSLVRIAERGGALVGTIEKLIDPKDKPDPVCEKCTDDRKGKPLVGLEIIRGDEILDPANGKTYRLRLTPVEGGRQLEVRGYIGTPLLGRTQTWIRVE